MTLTRRYRFSASHRLDVPALSVEENQRIFGKCNKPYGHGHDYVLDLTLEGAPDESGQIARRMDLDKYVADAVLSRVDHKNLNADVAELKGRVATTENVASMIRELLEPQWPFRARLARVRLAETDRNIFELETR